MANNTQKVFEKTGASVFIHGHTHTGARYDSENGKRRYVLPDWECETKPEYGGWIACYSDGSIRRFDLQGRLVTHYPGTE